MYEVPHELQAKLLPPLLTPKAKSLVSRLDAAALADVRKIKKFLLSEFRLMSREYRACFSAALCSDETYALSTSRLKNLGVFYMHSRDCDEFDKLVDLIIADRLKDTLGGPCLKYCLATEGNRHSDELAALADIFDANYTLDGWYRGGTVHMFKENNTQNQKLRGENEQFRIPPPCPPPPAESNTSQEGRDTATRPMATARSGVSRSSYSNTQQKCWVCLSPLHLKKDCPKARESSNYGHRQQTQVNACVIPEQAPIVSEEQTAVKEIQVNSALVLMIVALNTPV